MKIKENDPKKIRMTNLGHLWARQIKDLETLQRRMPGSILIGFDMTPAPNEVREFGLAVLEVNDANPHYSEGRTRFYEENNVKAYTWEVKPRLPNYEYKRHGVTIKVKSEEEAEQAMQKLCDELSNIWEARDSSEFRRLILVGWNLYTEFHWMSRKYDNLFRHVSDWIDVQDLVATQTGGEEMELAKALNALGIIDNRNNPNRHSSANDAVRSLAVLAALLDGKEVYGGPAGPPSESP